MAVVQKGAISFGLVYIPVDLHTATQDAGIGFNQLHRADGGRIRYKKVCARCGKETAQEDIVRGFEYAKGKYIVIEDEELEKIKTEKDRTVTIFGFVPPDGICPVYYDRAYYVSPQKGGEKALELLRQAMLKTKRAALGRTVIGNSEKLLALLPMEDGMLAKTLFYRDEVKDLPALSARSAPSNEELGMAEQLIGSMEISFAPEEYHDGFRKKLKELIADKIAGKEPAAYGKESPRAVADLMEALKASVKSAGAARKRTVPPKKSEKKKDA